MNDEQTNGGGDGRSRLDRIEAALELLIQDHEQFRAEHRMLLKAQVLMQDAMERGFAKFQEEMDEVTEKIDEVTDKLNGLIGAVDQFTRDTGQMRESFDARLRRLEGGP